MQNLIYALQDPTTDDFYYVGKSTWGLERPKQHLNCSHNKLVRDWVLSLNDDAMEPNIIILEECESPDFLCEKEKFWINKLLSEHHPLLNSIIYRSECDKGKLLCVLEKEIESKIKDARSKLDLINSCSKEGLGDTIKKRRKILKITQQELAEIADISANTLYKIERGQNNPTMKVINKLMNTLGVGIFFYVKKEN